MKFRSLAVANSIVPLLVCGCAAPPEPARSSGPADLALVRLRDDEHWNQNRRDQLDVLFGRVIASDQSHDAFDWLHVYVLAQVADRQDREARTSDAAELATRLDQIAHERTRDHADFHDDLTQLREEVRGLRELYAAGRTADATRK